MKLVAQVRQVLKPGIHTISTIENGELVTRGVFSPPARVEIEVGRDGACRVDRFTESGEFCGDTWHQVLEDAFHQLQYEYGLVESDFVAQS